MLIRKLKEWWSKTLGREVARLEMTVDFDFQCDPFFTAHRARSLRLAEIARERSALKDRLQKAIAQKKKRSGIYAALRALSVEELNIEAGR